MVRQSPRLKWKEVGWMKVNYEKKTERNFSYFSSIFYPSIRMYDVEITRGVAVENCRKKVALIFIAWRRNGLARCWHKLLWALTSPTCDNVSLKVAAMFHRATLLLSFSTVSSSQRGFVNVWKKMRFFTFKNSSYLNYCKRAKLNYTTILITLRIVSRILVILWWIALQHTN